jgi:hypothetical protein
MLVEKKQGKKLAKLYKKQIKVAKKYKIDRPDTWYLYQVYAPHDGRADGLGYVHFENSRDMIDFEVKNLKPVERKSKKTRPTGLAWFILGMLYAGLILAMVLWLRSFA